MKRILVYLFLAVPLGGSAYIRSLNDDLREIVETQQIKIINLYQEKSKLRTDNHRLSRISLALIQYSDINKVRKDSALMSDMIIHTTNQ